MDEAYQRAIEEVSGVAERKREEKTTADGEVIPAPRLWTGDDIHDVLTHDQCWRGFEHTLESIMLWLGRCSPEAVNRFREETEKTVAELKSLDRA